MSADPKVIPTALPMGVCLLAGRVVNKSRPYATRDGRRFSTVIALPAPDEFTAPQRVELRSSEALGQVGDTVRCKVRIGGYGRTYDSKGEDGEKYTVNTATNTLDVVEV